MDLKKTQLDSIMFGLDGCNAWFWLRLIVLDELDLTEVVFVFNWPNPNNNALQLYEQSFAFAVRD